MLKAIVCGATGYTGLELIKILVKHPEVEIAAISAKIDSAQRMSSIFPELKGKFDMICRDMQISEMTDMDADVVFLALPHTVSMSFVPHFMKKGIKVIDLSADFRLKDSSVYSKYYTKEHACKEYLKSAVYGLPELYKDQIKQAQLIANPGCYPTATILSLAPLASKEPKHVGEIIVDAKTGVTGAGRKASLAFNYGELAENMWAYKIGTHQHTPEIEQEVSTLTKHETDILFIPHLAPMKRGILATTYVKTKKNIPTPELVSMYKDFYKDAPFVRVCNEGEFPQTKNTYDSNFCDIGITSIKDRVVIVACIDNLIKGASGQAVQNMNLIFGFDERLGLL